MGASSGVASGQLGSFGHGQPPCMNVVEDNMWLCAVYALCRSQSSMF